MSGRGLKSFLYSPLRLVYGLTLWSQIANLRYPNKDYFRCPSDREFHYGKKKIKYSKSIYGINKSLF